MPSRPPTLKGIYANCTKEPAGCRIWKGALQNGYPTIYSPALYAEQKGGEKRGSGMVNGRKAVWAASGGEPLAEGYMLITSCGRKRCLCREHLLPTTNSGAKQAAAKRGAYQTEKHAAARLKNLPDSRKLSDEQVLAIKARVQAGESRQTIADELHIDRSTIDQFMRGDRRTGLPPVKKLPGCRPFSRFEPPPWFKGEFSREWAEKRATADTSA